MSTTTHTTTQEAASALRRRPRTNPTVPPAVWYRLSWAGRQRVIATWLAANRPTDQVYPSTPGLCATCGVVPVRRGTCKKCWSRASTAKRHSQRKPCIGCSTPIQIRSTTGLCRSCAAARRLGKQVAA